MNIALLAQAVKLVPDVLPHLSNKARYLYGTQEVKTQSFMLSAITGLVRAVYAGNLGGGFIDTMANVISGQLTQAYRQAMEDEGITDEFIPDYLAASLEAAILGQYDFVDQYYRDIVDASIDKTSVEPLLARVQLWAQRWTEGYNEAVRLITLKGGGNLEWTLGATEEHCPECASFNGMVARASEWDTLGIRPQNAPNDKITCGGWRCDCTLSPTAKRRSPNAYGRLEEILLAR